MRYGRLILLTATALLATGCAASSVLTLPAEGCSTLAASVLSRETPHATIGDTGDAALDWQLYGVAETGQLNIANRDKADGLAIITACERRDAAAQRRINAPAWQFWR